ncbi:unnamed protein product [Polarella glacialis]|uniref:FAD-binding FR-type domain-containing protein n=1 Tax=Polarella glacialis TaxID=89957 RepID=A0A813JQC7_POLGL|nr:unnamed protein product [Polarella glacialis]
MPGPLGLLVMLAALAVVAVLTVNWWSLDGSPSLSASPRGRDVLQKELLDRQGAVLRRAQFEAKQKSFVDFEMQQLLCLRAWYTHLNTHQSHFEKLKCRRLGFLCRDPQALDESRGSPTEYAIVVAGCIWTRRQCMPYLDVSELSVSDEDLSFEMSYSKLHARLSNLGGESVLRLGCGGELQTLHLSTDAHAEEHQDVLNIRFRPPTGIAFAAGDVAVIWPRADPDLVRRFVVETLERSLQEYVQIRPLSSHGGEDVSCPFPDRPLSLEEIFSSYVDLSALPTRHFFHVLSLYTDHELHKGKLQELASRTLEAKDALYEYCKRERRSAAEVMWDFWTARPPLPELLSCLPLLRPRRYSIASCPGWYSPSASPAVAARFWRKYQRACGPAWRPQLEGDAASSSCMAAMSQAGSENLTDFDLCVAVVEYTTRTNRQCKGLCSSFLKDSRVGEKVRCSLERGSLWLPPQNVPLILVCPGTGLSPCRSLVQQRHLQILSSGSSNQDRFAAGMKDLMFLGFRHKDGDFLYGDEWGSFGDWLAVKTAFSRDHEDKKVYVQDDIEEHGAHVVRLLDAGAVIFVCGRCSAAIVWV